MRAHPDLVAFPGAIDTELMAAELGLVAKVGAEGVIGIGLTDGRALALKVLDGTPRALDLAAVAAARVVLGLPAAGRALDRLAGGAIANSRGELVGRLEAELAGG
jgi:L-asparaginase II